MLGPVLVSSSVYASVLSGVIREEGKPLEMVEVILIDAGSSLMVGSKFTSKKGHYSFTVKKGAYRLSASKDEYADVWVSNIKINNKNVTRNIELVPSALVMGEEDQGQSDDCD